LHQGISKHLQPWAGKPTTTGNDPLHEHESYYSHSTYTKGNRSHSKREDNTQQNVPRRLPEGAEANNELMQLTHPHAEDNDWHCQDEKL
jgi:hypothetical protein